MVQIAGFFTSILNVIQFVCQKNKSMETIIKSKIFGLLLITSFIFNGKIHAQEFDEQNSDRLEQSRLSPNFIKAKWEIAVEYGNWFFTKGSKSTNSNELFFLPENMNIWQFDVIRHFNKKAGAYFSLGIQQAKDIPPTPGIIAILSGQDLKIEGSGGGFVPLKSGILYYPSKYRLNPFFGAGIGVTMAKSQYTEVKGNIFDGITKTDFTSNDFVPLSDFNVGCNYQSGKFFRFTLKADYTFSTKFDDSIGGYNRYEGITLFTQIAAVF